MLPYFAMLGLGFTGAMWGMIRLSAVCLLWELSHGGRELLTVCYRARRLSTRWIPQDLAGSGWAIDKVCVNRRNQFGWRNCTHTAEGGQDSKVGVLDVLCVDFARVW